MSLPSVEPILPEENEPLPPARRRRRQRNIIPPGEEERSGFLYELSVRVVPSFDFFMFSLLSGIVLGAALLIDSPALIFLATLLAPFMSPVIGMSLGTITGTLRFWMQSLMGLLVGSLMVFFCGLLSGWAASLQPARPYLQAAAHSQFTWAGFLVLALGAGLTTYLIVRSPAQKPLVTSVAIAYSLYLPIGVAGFGLSSGVAGLWPGGLILLIVHLIWANLISTVVLAALGLRPLNSIGYLLGFSYLALGLLVMVLMLLTGGSPAVSEIAAVATPSLTQQVYPTASPTASEQTPVPSNTDTARPPTATRTLPTPSITPTNTLVPTRTPTLTMSPAPTPVWARVNAKEGDGILIRSEPSFTANLVQSLLNGTLVEVLPDVVNSENVTWVKIRTVNGKEGWVVRSLLATATPAPNW